MVDLVAHQCLLLCKSMVHTSWMQELQISEIIITLGTEKLTCFTQNSQLELVFQHVIILPSQRIVFLMTINQDKTIRKRYLLFMICSQNTNKMDFIFQESLMQVFMSLICFIISILITKQISIILKYSSQISKVLWQETESLTGIMILVLHIWNLHIGIHLLMTIFIIQQKTALVLFLDR